MIRFRTFSSLNQKIETRFLLVLLLSVLICKCSSQKSTALQPDKQRYQFKALTNLSGDNIVLADLDSNGFTDIITRHSSFPHGQTGSFILLLTFEGKVIEQVNYPGKIIDEIFTLDYNDDGILEILVPFVRNDSLFVSFVNARGKKLFCIFLIDGKPRVEDGGSFKWDPQIKSFYIRDLDNNGEKELITVMTTGYARLPRGILIHSLPDGKLMGKSIIGSPPRDNFLDDFDGDGQPEILCFGTAPNNGANVSGFDDKYSYFILFDITPVIRVARYQKISDKFSNYILFYEDFDGDGKKDLLAWTECNSERKPELKIAELDPMTFNEKKKWSIDTQLITVIITNLNRDTLPEIVAIRSSNDIVVLNNQFEEIKHNTLPLISFSIKAVPDLDNDGINEIVVVSQEGDFLLDSDLKIKASFPDLHCAGVIRRGDNLSPQLVVRNKDHYELGLLVENKFYLVKRYYLVVFYILLLGFSFLSGRHFIHLQRHNRFLNSVQSLVIDSDSRGFMLIDHKQRVYMMNRTLKMWLGITENKKNRNKRLTDIISPYTEVLAFLNDTINRPARRYEKTLNLKFGSSQRQVQLTMDPVIVNNKKKPLWLVTFLDKSSDDEILLAKTWCKMAQKAAHDIKNPLSAITLTLQRLQMLSQEKSPQMSDKLDLYVARVIERIESLKRISKNFMKFVNIENLNFVTTNLNQFLIETTNIIRAGLPPDIQLHFKPGDDLPMVKVDQDAIRSVAENLVSNAINAMPEGGMITITTQFLQGLTFPVNGMGAKDYILVEVSDTGTGIPDADLNHLFEPDFTTTEGGNGLGLAYVKKTVDDHSGYIDVESEKGVGTTFNVYIPTL